MVYLKFIFIILILEYLLLIFHELLHLASGKINKLKLNYIYIYPFVINVTNKKISLTLYPIFNSTSYSKFLSINIIDENIYKIKLKTLQRHLLLPYIFDFIIFIILFLTGLINPSLVFLTIISMIHFVLMTINFFSFDGKYAIGSKYDEKLAFVLMLNFTLLCEGNLEKKTLDFFNKKYLKLTSNINIEDFNVNDLWNYINLLKFYNYSIILLLNNILTKNESNIDKFANMLYKNYKKIASLDYRQIKETNEFLILYYIYRHDINRNNQLEFYQNFLITMECNSFFESLFEKTFYNLVYKFKLPPEFSYTNKERNLLLSIINKDK